MIKLSCPGVVVAGGVALDKDALKTFYAGRRYTLAWDAPGIGLGQRAGAAVAALMSADADGLDPADYHVQEIVRLAAADGSSDRFDRDLLISDGLIHFLADVAGGKLTPAETDERVQFSRAIDPADQVVFVAALDADSIPAYIVEKSPQTSEYRTLKATLAALRMIDPSGWQKLPDGGTIHPGTHDPAVPELRRRLFAEGRIASTAVKPADADLYGPSLSAAVIAFQRQHGIKPDGSIGKDTRAALDTSLEQRSQQIVVNLERARWTAAPPEGRRVEINLAAYSLKVFQDGQPILTMPVVVGSKENPTPIIDSRITTVVLNPNWTLPPVVIKELIPRLRDNTDYLAQHGIARLEEGGHIRLVQPPGPTNPLGHYKFVFPNDQDIYLHDSPDSAKFRYALRAYSHGCIRLGNPAALAALLLEDRASAFPMGLDDLVQTGTTHRIALSNPVPVTLVYRTTWLDGDGRLVIGEDSYGRDQRLWKALHKIRAGTGRRLAAQISQPGAL